MKIARVFPRKTSQSPDDELAFFDGPGLFPPQVDEVHISVSFTYDLIARKGEKMSRVEYIEKQWRGVAPIKIGGPAFGKPSGEFVTGRYVKPGITFTSRGCTNKCWFCSVWKREPKMIELDIKPGHIIQDDNFLACSESHIRKVFEMLKSQKERPHFAGGLEAKILQDWHCELLSESKTESMYFAYDTKDDLEPLICAGDKLYNHGFGWPNKAARCFVLLGFPNDTISEAEQRFYQTIDAGFWPQAMLWRNEKGETDKTWAKFAREWARPAIYYERAMRHFYSTGI
jgi:hypothetical protein